MYQEAIQVRKVDNRKFRPLFIERNYRNFAYGRVDNCFAVIVSNNCPLPNFNVVEVVENVNRQLWKVGLDMRKGKPYQPKELSSRRYRFYSLPADKVNKYGYTIYELV